MATANDVFKRALRLIGVLGQGETLNAAQQADCIYACNTMLDSWRNERLMVYQIAEVVHTLVASQGNYTIGPGADIDTTRPLKIEQAWVRHLTFDYPINVSLDADAWAGILNKSISTTYPTSLYYEPSVSTGTIHVWPVPNAANDLYLQVWQPLLTIADGATAITLPPGYEEAMAFGLAMRLAPEYGIDPPAIVLAGARETKAIIKRVNAPVVKSSISDLQHGRRYNIYADR